MLTFHFSKKTYGPIPDKYNELNKKQLIRIAALIVSNEEMEVARVKALRILLKMGFIRFALMNPDSKARMLDQVDWVFERNGLTKQHITYFRGMYGPADEWDNLTMGEWNACEIFYTQLVEDKKEDALDKMIAVLYRRKKWFYNAKRDPDGDIRVKFNSHENDYWRRNTCRWPNAVKIAILFWYDGCREHIKELYDLFDGSNSEPGDPGMFDVIRGLCGKKYGSIREVEDMNVHLALRELECMKKEAREIERTSH